MTTPASATGLAAIDHVVVLMREKAFRPSWASTSRERACPGYLCGPSCPRNARTCRIQRVRTEAGPDLRRGGALGGRDRVSASSRPAKLITRYESAVRIALRRWKISP